MPNCKTTIAYTLIFATIALATEPNYDVHWYVANPEAKTFTISTAEELAGLAAIVNRTWKDTAKWENFAEKTITLAKNIDLSQYKNWVPIGDCNNMKGYKFSGIFNGNGHIIKNLTINNPDKNFQGLFGCMNIGGTVKNLGVENVNIRGKRAVGGVAGYIEWASKIHNSYSTGTVSGKSLVGGIAGEVFGISSISNSYSASTVSCDVACGGIVGSIHYDYESKVDSSYSTGAISGKLFVGGIAGEVSDGSLVANSYSTGMVSGDEMVGGIVGGISGQINNCSAQNSEVKGNKNVGRVVGLYVKQKKKDELSNNTAHTEIKNKDGNATWHNKGANNKDGADIIAEKTK